MFRNALAYVTRKRVKSLILLLIILAMSTLSLISFSIKTATNNVASESFKNIDNSFSIQINRSVNPGTPRGAGNVKGEYIKKISDNKNIKNYVKRINIVADLVDHDIVKSSSSDEGNEQRRENFKKTIMGTGVNDSSKEDKFTAGTFKLVSGRHIKNGDKNVVLVHEELAKKNNLKVGDKLTLKSNLFDADNVKRADEKVELTIVGIFSGKNSAPVTYDQELYANNVITDVASAAKLYGNTENTATYQDATFYVSGSKNIDQVMDEIKNLNVDWQSYNLVKSTSNYPLLQKSISGIYDMVNNMFIASIVFSLLVLTLILFIWINSRIKEIGIMLSLGISKIKIMGQFIIELLYISIFGFGLSYFLANLLGNFFASSILEQVNSSIMQQPSGSQLGAGAEADSFNKTISSLNVSIDINDMYYVVFIGLIVIIISLLLASMKIMKKKPKQLLSSM